MADDCHYRKHKFVKVLPSAQPPSGGKYRPIKWEELLRLWDESGHTAVLCDNWNHASIAAGGGNVAGYARKGCLKGYFQLTHRP